MRNFSLLVLFIFTHIPYCISQENSSDEQYLFNEIETYIYGPKHNRKKSKGYLSKVKELTKKGSNEAFYFLGMLQKDGIGTKQNFKKSRKSFKKAYDLGNNKAAYCLGYYYLKGFGDIQQDYKKAYKWFKKSEEPMAKHWLAKMQFLGLGRKSNKKKALSILNSNNLYNSKVLARQYESQELPGKVSSKLFHKTINEYSINDIYALNGFSKVPNFNSLEGDWEGEYFELDWAKNKILRTIPIELGLIKEEGVNEQLRAQLKISDSTATDIGSYNAGGLRFGNLQIPIKKQYTDYPNFTHLMTDIRNFELRELQSTNENILVGKLTAFFPVWQERANPSFVILRKKINEEAQIAFEEQSSDFIRLYPNPYSQYLLVNFELLQEANVKVKITNYYNTPLYQKTIFEGHKPIGNHTLEINTPPTHSGSYMISIEYNGKLENKIIVKN